VSLTKYLTPKQIMDKYPYFSTNKMYLILARREINGLKEAITKVGKRLLINEELFDVWFKSSPKV